MDLVAYRILRFRVNLKPDDCLSQKVWKHIASDKGGIMGNVKELETTNAYRGIAWMVNPHEQYRFNRAYDPMTDLAIQHCQILIWAYALMPRNFAMLRRLQGGRSQSGIKTQPPSRFVGRQKFI